MLTKILVTGGLGFIGSEFVRRAANSEKYAEVRVLDAKTYAANLASLSTVSNNNKVKITIGDICDQQLVRDLVQGTDVVVNFAAESHVDNSIGNVNPFLKSNVEGVINLLESVRHSEATRFVQISTDEVYGSIASGSFSENAPLLPRNPYSASKASAENFCLAFANTYGLDVTITRSCNNYGPFQQSEKYIPNSIKALLSGKKISVYGDGSQEREWIHVTDNCEAIDQIISDGNKNEIYNIGSNFHMKNLELAHLLVEISGRKEECIEFVEDRPGHDQRYSVDSSKIYSELKWNPKINFEDGILETFEWYKANFKDIK